MTTWNADLEETFSFMAAHFDVSAAKRILTAKAHKVGDMPVAEVAPLVGEPGKLTMGIAVNWDHVQSDAIDLTIPVILAYTKSGSLLPIDGWHRIAKAKLAGIENLPAVMLNKAESKRCWL
jgi:hypothetical protein